MRENDPRVETIFADWLRTEFEQNFVHLRDRDARMMELTKFHVGLVCSVLTACVALGGLPTLGHKVPLIGGLCVATSVVGMIVDYVPPVV